MKLGTVDWGIGKVEPVLFSHFGCYFLDVHVRFHFVGAEHFLRIEAYWEDGLLLILNPQQYTFPRTINGEGVSIGGCWGTEVNFHIRVVPHENFFPGRAQISTVTINSKVLNFLHSRVRFDPTVVAVQVLTFLNLILSCILF